MHVNQSVVGDTFLGGELVIEPKTSQMSANRRLENVAQHLAPASATGSSAPKGIVD
jgi:hypothetical protein